MAGYGYDAPEIFGLWVAFFPYTALSHVDNVGIILLHFYTWMMYLWGWSISKIHSFENHKQQNVQTQDHRFLMFGILTTLFKSHCDMMNVDYVTSLQT